MFNAIHAKNAVDETGKTSSVMIDKKNPGFYQTVTAVKNGEVYTQMAKDYGGFKKVVLK
ncbi:hypothetical protein DEHRE_01390 [Dehalobacter restrictus DSM 9455]|uniref:Uncharacterized protein n=1 Tax=Dehalobacter restrictus (strain DSM 9455 / PER-K23) TaxID=871738 RepID=A0ABN4BVW8_DEHRP|nr:hypothetical protein DEHRE_01390 [Dehalobacter restrictus DSM 9455]